LGNLWRGRKARGRDKGKEGEKARGVYKAGAEEGWVGREDGRERQEAQRNSMATSLFLGFGFGTDLGEFVKIFIN
jgi:hypothetical protein